MQGFGLKSSLQQWGKLKDALSSFAVFRIAHWSSEAYVDLYATRSFQKELLDNQRALLAVRVLRERIQLIPGKLHLMHRVAGGQRYRFTPTIRAEELKGAPSQDAQEKRKQKAQQKQIRSIQFAVDNALLGFSNALRLSILPSGIDPIILRNPKYFWLAPKEKRYHR